jgi:hypothetical protein
VKVFNPLVYPHIATMASRGIPLDTAAIMSIALEGILYGEQNGPSITCLL